MPLPVSRDTTYAASSQVKSADLNDIQDCIIGNRKPTMTKIFGPNGGGILPLAPANWSAAGPNPNPGGNYFWSVGGAVAFMVYFPVEVGDRITGLSARAYGDGAADCTFTAGYFDASGVLQTLGSLNDVNRAAAWGDAVMGGWTNHTIVAGEILGCYVQINAANYRIQKWAVTYDRLTT
jgi:hypothetical protein